jgi:hypothetical protein
MLLLLLFEPFGLVVVVSMVLITGFVVYGWNRSFMGDANNTKTNRETKQKRESFGIKIKEDCISNHNITISPKIRDTHKNDGRVVQKELKIK